MVAETADVAFGDAWVEPYSSDGRGTNVVITRHPTVQALIKAAMKEQRLAMTSVDATFIANTQAAGLRQRREGLAYRLRIAPPALPLRKRVAAGGRELPLRRKLIYRARYHISAFSHRFMRAARLLHRPGLYLSWARVTLRLYRVLAYGKGRFGEN